MNSAILYLFNSFVLLTLLSACSAGAGLPPPVPTQTTLPAATPTFPAQTPVPSTRLQPTLGPVVTLSPEEAPACRVLDSILPAVAKPMSAIPPVDMSTDHVSGATNPKITIVEYSDFQCPYCAQYSQQLEPQIMANYAATGKIYYQFVPYSFIGAESYAASQATYCAMDQGKFWEYHDLLYANQKGENKGDFSSSNLTAFAKAINLDTATFDTCLSSNKYTQKVNDDKNFAYQSGARGSPYFLVNGTLVGSDTLIATIDKALVGK